MRFSFPDFDKYNRCPTWSGSRLNFRKEDSKYDCDNGSIIALNPKYKANDFEDMGHWKWKFHQCSKCGVWVLPYVVRYLFPREIYRHWENKFSNWKVKMYYKSKGRLFK